MAARILSEHFSYSPSPRRRLLVTGKTRPVVTGGLFPPVELSVISEIMDGKLYLSGCDAVTTSNLISKGITAVVCAMSDWEEHRSNVVDRVPRSTKRIRVPVLDSETTDIGSYFDSVTRFIDDELKNGGRVLVHCVAGVSRSTSLVLAYLIRYRGYSLLEAFHLVAEKRKIAWPNDGFYRQLIAYERRLKNDKNATVNGPNLYSTIFNGSKINRSRSPILIRNKLI